MPISRRRAANPRAVRDCGNAGCDERDGACPFGVALRPVDAEAGQPPPFPTWAYHAPYLPAQVSIGIALATPLTEPEFLHLTFATRPDAKNREPMAHPAAFGRLTGVRIGMPGERVTLRPPKRRRRSGLVAFFRRRRSTSWS